MATHIIKLSDEVVSRRQVGNSMSTEYEWDGHHTVTVYWKEGWRTSMGASPGDRVMVRTTGGGNPPVKVTVMTPPRDAVARAAWERGFYSKKRVETLEKLEKSAEAVGGRVSTSPSGRAAVIYRPAMGGWIGVPFRWWASSDATADDVSAAIEDALSRNELHEYT